MSLTVRDMDGNVIPQSCMDLARDAEGKLVILPSGDRLCCYRTAGHRSLHASQDDDGREVEWR